MKAEVVVGIVSEGKAKHINPKMLQQFYISLTSILLSGGRERDTSIFFQPHPKLLAAWQRAERLPGTP